MCVLSIYTMQPYTWMTHLYTIFLSLFAFCHYCNHRRTLQEGKYWQYSPLAPMTDENSPHKNCNMVPQSVDWPPRKICHKTLPTPGDVCKSHSFKGVIECCQFQMCFLTNRSDSIHVTAWVWSPDCRTRESIPYIQAAQRRRIFTAQVLST